MTHVKTPHPRAAMMKAYADDTSLCVFVKSGYTGAWWLLSRDIAFNKHQDFFACLPQHKEACLHWLNGGEVEFLECGSYHQISSKIKWSSSHLFMGEMFQTRIKPRNEKFWLVVKTDKHVTFGGFREARVCSHAFVNKADTEDYLKLGDSQLIEIEVEV